MTFEEANIAMLFGILAAAIAAFATTPGVVGGPVPESPKREQSHRNSLRVDLGYAVYEGFLNQSTGLNSFLGS